MKGTVRTRYVKKRQEGGSKKKRRPCTGRARVTASEANVTRARKRARPSAVVGAAKGSQEVPIPVALLPIPAGW